MKNIDKVKLKNFLKENYIFPIESQSDRCGDRFDVGIEEFTQALIKHLKGNK